MIGAFLSWWLLSSLLGLAAFPLAWRIFSRLPDRGYGFSRALGVMAAGYLLWIGTSLRVFQNTLGGTIVAVAILGALGLWASAGHWRDLICWLRQRRRMVFTMELVFLASFGLWAFVRANNPEITGTEKPMELAFLNAILRSKTFPPQDPWLSGYAISYYYYGYILLAVLTRLTGVAGSVAFNLGNSMWFGLSLLGTYALLYNLFASQKKKPLLTAPLLGPLFVLISGNLEGFLEVLHARHIFWREDESGALVSKFWEWLNIKQLVNSPLPEPAWIPSRHWWWWRASRVVNDLTLLGDEVEVIDEIPFFSFLLADNHPHVLALPFVLMAIALAYQIYLGGNRGESRLGKIKFSQDLLSRIQVGAAAVILILAVRQGVVTASQGSEFPEVFISVFKVAILGILAFYLMRTFLLLVIGYLPSALNRMEFWFGAWLFGGLIFLNTWDFPIYVSLLMAVMWWWARSDRLIDALKRIVFTTIGLAAAGILLFLPWYPSFSSQAGGILPNLIFPTRLQHFLVMFATSFVPILVWLIRKVRSDWQTGEWRGLVVATVGLPLSLLLLSWALGGVAMAILVRGETLEFEAVLAGMGAISIDEVIQASLLRLTNAWTALTLGAIIALSGLLLWRKIGDSKSTQEDEISAWPFVVLMIGIGALLILGPEFIYLRDLFLTRMNTVFKFYFASWILWGIAAAYAVHELWPRRWSWAGVARTSVTLPLILGLFYPLMAVDTRTNGFNPNSKRTLDGAAYIEQYNPGDYEAIQWINDQLPYGVIAEAVGGSYSYYARISVHTGFPTVLGWGWHEVQWRGNANAQGSRQGDVELLYKTRHWEEARSILDRYDIDYVFVGSLERTTYEPVLEEKFIAFMDLVYENDDVRIYTRRGEAMP